MDREGQRLDREQKTGRDQQGSPATTTVQTVHWRSSRRSDSSVGSRRQLSCAASGRPAPACGAPLRAGASIGSAADDRAPQDHELGVLGKLADDLGRAVRPARRRDHPAIEL